MLVAWSETGSRRDDRACRGLEAQAWDWNRVTSATFCWPEQVASPAQIQDVGKYTVF